MTQGRYLAAFRGASSLPLVMGGATSHRRARNTPSPWTNPSIAGVYSEVAILKTKHTPSLIVENDVIGKTIVAVRLEVRERAGQPVDIDQRR